MIQDKLKDLKSIPLTDHSEAVRRHVDPSSPPPLRLMAAKAMVPLPPEELVTVLLLLENDASSQLAQVATESLDDLPGDILVAASKAQAIPEVLDAMAKRFWKNPNVLEALVLNRACSDESVAHLARKARGHSLELISNNQSRLLRYPAIIEALYMNPHTPMSTADRVVQFAVRNGVTVDSIPAFKEVAEALGLSSGAQGDSKDASRTDAPFPPNPDYDMSFNQIMALSIAESSAKGMSIDGDSSDILDVDMDALSQEAGIDLDQLQKMLGTEQDNGGNEENSLKDRLRLLNNMTASQKIRLALMGNKTDRSVLIRDSQKLVVMAVIKSPKITDSEVASYATNRALNEEVIRFISNKREWIKNYRVKLALVGNPKTPARQALSFLPHLRPNDLKTIARDKNIPSMLANSARMLLRAKAGG